MSLALVRMPEWRGVSGAWGRQFYLLNVVDHLVQLLLHLEQVGAAAPL